MRIRIAAVLCAMILARGWQHVTAAQRPEFSADVRLAQIVQANIVAVHAYQALLAKRSGRGDPACYAPGGMSDAELDSLVEHQARLLASDRMAVRAWARGDVSSKFDPRQNLDPILTTPLRVPDSAPVNVFSAFLRARIQIPLVQLRAIANLYQTILEIDRDGDRLQELFDFYIALGLPVYLGQFGFSGTDEDFLAAGEELARGTCASPFATDAAAWQIAGRKVWNWAEKKLHIRDERVMANELMTEPDVAALLPAIRALPPAKVAIIGHSFTMGAHWSSPSSFVPIVSSIVSRENPKIVFRQFEAGGLTASRAQQLFLREALDWKPDKVLLVVMTRRDADYTALAEIGQRIRKSGAECIVFDDLHDPESADPETVKRFNETARGSGMTIIEVDRILSTAPGKENFLSLDRIHMREPYHRLMAKQWLQFLANPAIRGERR